MLILMWVVLWHSPESNFTISIQISLKLVHTGSIYNNSTLVQVMPSRRQAITWTNADPVHRHIYVALGRDELKEMLAFMPLSYIAKLTHWGRVTHIFVGNLMIIGSDNGLSPVRRQAIIWTNAETLSIRPLGTNFSEILAEIITFSFKKIYLKVSSAKWRPFCLGLNELNQVRHSPKQWNECVKNASILYQSSVELTT